MRLEHQDLEVADLFEVLVRRQHEQLKNIPAGLRVDLEVVVNVEEALLHEGDADFAGHVYFSCEDALLVAEAEHLVALVELGNLHLGSGDGVPCEQILAEEFDLEVGVRGEVDGLAAGRGFFHVELPGFHVEVAF